MEKRVNLTRKSTILLIRDPDSPYPVLSPGHKRRALISRPTLEPRKAQTAIKATSRGAMIGTSSLPKRQRGARKLLLFPDGAPHHTHVESNRPERSGS